MRRHTVHARQGMRGISLLGLMFWVVLIGFVAVVAMKSFPAINEYLTVKRAVHQISTGGGGTVQEIRAAFDKQKEIEYSITSLSGKDLDVTKDNGEKVLITFKYDKEVPLYGPVSLLFHFEGDSK